MRLGSSLKQGVACLFVLVPVLLPVSVGSGQDITKKRLDHEAYDEWNTLSRDTLSNDGQWVMYTVQNGAIEGPSTTIFFNPDNGKRYVVERATSAVFTDDSRYVIYRINPEKKKTSDSSAENARPQVQCLELATGTAMTIDAVRTFSVPKESGRWLACLLDSPPGPKAIKSVSQSRETFGVTGEGLEQKSKPVKLKSRAALARERGELKAESIQEKSGQPTKKSTASGAKAAGKESGSSSSEAEKKDKQPGNPLLLIDLHTGIRRTYPNVTSYRFSKNGSHVAFITSVPKGSTKTTGKSANLVDGVYLIKLDNFSQSTLLEGLGQYRGLTFSSDGEKIAFLGNRDDYQAKTPSWSVFLASTKKTTAKKIASETTDGIPSGWWVAPQSGLQFSDDMARLYFDTAPISEKVLEERKSSGSKKSSTEEEKKGKAKLDLWHWKDPQLQPQQLLRAQSERTRTYQAAYVFDGSRVVQLETRLMPSIGIDYRSKSRIAVANTNLPYQKSLSWDVPGFQDVVLVNLDTGTRQKVAERVKWSAALSPEGNYITWFDAEKRQWFSQSTRGANAKPILISRGVPHPLQNELHDTPSLARPYGAAGWLADDRAVLVYDRYDIWRLDPAGKLPAVCITSGKGREAGVRYRYLKLDSEQRAIAASEALILSAFNTKTKASGFVSLEAIDGKDRGASAQLKQLIMLEESVSSLEKAKNGDRVIFKRSTFRNCPDLWSSKLAFKEITRVSDINPQQENYSWGTAELVHWKAADGQDLDGILLKPDGFDPSKKYPMMVYFYERNSDNLHRYYTPAAGRSIICHSFYVSRGYLVFIPDIPYKTGEPGPSAVNSILPGVDHLVKKGFVHENKIGLQGHSWGGYQTAYLVTQTDRFACAESGAPVSNMTSAYGGIRWASGLSRMFQYERTQSRIGQDLWSARDKYVANSPLFFADQINTPLLILHNDRDGAVPWYQGIELFVALRRLGRPAWMLNYNGEPHWVMEDYNRRDFAKRMQQFFDHYLLDAPEPQWMAVGIPATEKGEEYGFELLEPEK